MVMQHALECWWGFESVHSERVKWKRLGRGSMIVSRWVLNGMFYERSNELSCSLKWETFWMSQMTISTVGSTSVHKLVSYYCISMALVRVKCGVFGISVLWFNPELFAEPSKGLQYVCLCLPSCLFPWDFRTKTLFIFLVFFLCTSCHGSSYFFNWSP
jgi:hypothetical protein